MRKGQFFQQMILSKVANQMKGKCFSLFLRVGQRLYNASKPQCHQHLKAGLIWTDLSSRRQHLVLSEIDTNLRNWFPLLSSNASIKTSMPGPTDLLSIIMVSRTHCFWRRTALHKKWNVAVSYCFWNSLILPFSQSSWSILPDTTVQWAFEDWESMSLGDNILQSKGDALWEAI